MFYIFARLPQPNLHNDLHKMIVALECDIIMLQEVGDHVTGCEDLRNRIRKNRSVNLHMAVYCDGGYMTLVRKDLCTDVEHKLVRMFPKIKQGSERSRGWRQSQHLTLNCCVGPSRTTREVVHLFNVHIVSGQS